MSTYCGVNFYLAYCFFSVLNVKPLSRHFQPGEGPSRGLLRDCKTSCNLREPSFEALVGMVQWGQAMMLVTGYYADTLNIISLFAFVIFRVFANVGPVSGWRRNMFLILSAMRFPFNALTFPWRLIFLEVLWKFQNINKVSLYEKCTQPRPKTPEVQCWKSLHLFIYL